MDWGDLGDGNDLVSSYPHGAPAGVGHMIGAVVDGGAVTTVHDVQQRTEPYLLGNAHATYIYKM